MKTSLWTMLGLTVLGLTVACGDGSNYGNGGATNPDGAPADGASPGSDSGPGLDGGGTGATCTSGNFVVTTSAGATNGVPFTVRSGKIYCVSTAGADTNGGSFPDKCFGTLTKAKSSRTAGDITYAEDGVTQATRRSFDSTPDSDSRPDAPAASAVGSTGRVYAQAVSGSTFTALWTAGPFDDAEPSNVAVVANRVVVTARLKVHILDLATGRVVAEFPFTGRTSVCPVRGDPSTALLGTDTLYDVRSLTMLGSLGSPPYACEYSLLPARSPCRKRPASRMARKTPRSHLIITGRWMAGPRWSTEPPA